MALQHGHRDRATGECLSLRCAFASYGVTGAQPPGHYGGFTYTDNSVHAFCVRTKGGRTAELFVDYSNVPHYDTQGGVGFHYTIWDTP